MAKSAFPSTTLQPKQVMDFHCVDGNKVPSVIRTVLTPRPDSSRTVVEHVDLQYTDAGGSWLHSVANQGNTLTVIQAGTHAYKIAQHEAIRSSTSIVEIFLDTEEFLEKTDVDIITGCGIPVKIKS